MSKSIPTLTPPDERFWRRYSPHYEFPLSSVGSIAMHVGAVALFGLAMYLLATTGTSATDPVPIQFVAVPRDEGKGMGLEGPGGGNPVEQGPPSAETNSQPAVPEATIEAPTERLREPLPTGPNAARPVDPATLDKFADLKRRLSEGTKGGTGKGPNRGDGLGKDGKGQDDRGADSSARRGGRWVLHFRTTSGQDYLDQLAAMKATLIFPQPNDWKSLKVYRDIHTGNRTGEPFDVSRLPQVLYFIDEDAASAAKLATAMGLGFAPPKFIALFPKDVENSLAAKERAFQGRREDQIARTEFQILIRDGKMEPTVIRQEPIRR